MPPSDTPLKQVVLNRKALRDYFVLEKLEAGLELRGTEVKSIRGGHISLTGAFARVEGGQVRLHSLNIPAYEYGGAFNHEPDRPRRLLLHRKEIRHLAVQVDQKGHALIPLRIYIRRGRVKVELGLCKGKHHQDKREVLRRRTAEREAARAMARSTRRPR